MSASEGRIELHGAGEVALGELVLALREAIHVPESAMIGFPSVQGIGRLEKRPVSFHHLYLRGNRRDDAVADSVEHREGVVELVMEPVRPDDPRRANLDELNPDGYATFAASHASAGDEIDVQPSTGILRPDASFRQREDRASGNDEEIPQFGQAGDDVVGEAIGEAAANAFPAYLFEERHDRERSAASFASSGRRGVGSGLRPWPESGPGVAHMGRSTLFARPPGRPYRREVQAFGLEESRRGGEVLLGLADPSLPRQLAQEHRMRGAIKGSNLDPLLQMGGCFVAPRRKLEGELLQYRRVARRKAPSLRRQPGVEVRTSINGEAFEKLAHEQARERTQPIRIDRFKPRSGGRCDLESVHETAAEIERHPVV
ncbi:MAG TPA: hypothetical protein VLX85_16835 [Stellaceae bacterium]|nr:hypothetical protein [Stellaceae bacterium]